MQNRFHTTQCKPFKWMSVTIMYLSFWQILFSYRPWFQKEFSWLKRNFLVGLQGPRYCVLRETPSLLLTFFFCFFIPLRFVVYKMEANSNVVFFFKKVIYWILRKWRKEFNTLRFCNDIVNQYFEKLGKWAIMRSVVKPSRCSQYLS